MEGKLSRAVLLFMARVCHCRTPKDNPDLGALYRIKLGLPRENKGVRVSNKREVPSTATENEFPKEELTYTCDQCGACCRTFCVRVSERDAEREPRIRNESIELQPWIQTRTWKYQIFPLPFHTGCCFLKPDNRCSVYETRPELCRDFQPGSDACQIARKEAGFTPLRPKSA